MLESDCRLPGPQSAAKQTLALLQRRLLHALQSAPAGHKGGVGGGGGGHDNRHGYKEVTLVSLRSNAVNTAVRSMCLHLSTVWFSLGYAFVVSGSGFSTSVGTTLVALGLLAANRDGMQK